MSGLAIRLSALAIIAWLNGLFYLWVKEGFRERRDWQIMLESLVVWVFISSLVWFVYTLVLGWKFQVTGAEIILSLSALAEQGLGSIRGTKAACATVLYLVINYLVSLFLGWCSKRRQEVEKPFSVPVKSALDIEMLQLRKNGYIPLVVVRFTDGREVCGKCLKYSFSEPRELNS